jgi:peptide deformylase
MAEEQHTLEQPGADADERDDVEVESPEHSQSVPELDPETRARRDAALRHVRKLGDPVLRAAALPVDRFDEDLRGEVERMGELMRDALGIGLAANQVGVLHRVLVFKAYEEDELTALVNPVIEWASEELEVAEEGCLSLPGVHVEVERPAQVRVRAQDERGAPLEIDAEGLRARVIQHEIDHLDGVLILDRISREARKQAMRAMREAQREGAGDEGNGAGGEQERAREPQGAGETQGSGEAQSSGEAPGAAGDRESASGE